MSTHHLRGAAVWCALIGAFSLSGDRPASAAIANGEPIIIPHVFNVATGGSAVILQNLSSSAQDISVEFFAQDGSFFDLTSTNVPALGQAQVDTPAGPTGDFIGSALIFGNAPFTARGQWNFAVGSMPLVVGVPALLMSQTSSTYQLPIGSVPGNSRVGVAIENPSGGGSINCTISYRDAAGQAVAEDAYTVPSFGQVSEFATSVPAGFAGSGTVQCSGAAAVIAVIQEQINGFPTPLFGPPAS